MTGTVAVHPPRGDGAPGLGATIASEWLKLTSLRLTWILSSLAALLGIGATVLVSVIIGLTWADWGPEERAGYDPVLTPPSA